MKIELEVKTLGEYLKYKMVERKVSYHDIAPEIGMSIATLSRILHNGAFEIKWIIPLAKWCGLSTDQLWDLLEPYGAMK